MNYQAKWSVYWACCHRHGHSVSRATVAEVADFLLYLGRSLYLSYSSIASYRSMLSGVFRFVLTELSSHFVISSGLFVWSALSPPLVFLLGIFSLFLVFFAVLPLSLCPSVRFGTLPRRSCSWCRWPLLAGWASFRLCPVRCLCLGRTCFFRTFLSSVRRLSLPQSFCVRSLWDLVGDHPEELLLCPVRAVRVYLSRTSSFSPRPHSLFVSPRAPSHPLSKNALSVFLREVISQPSSSSSFSSSSSSGPSAPSPSPSSSGLSCPAASSFRLHSIRGVGASVAFAHNAPLSSVLAVATWPSFTVFTSLYLKDVQFSFPLGFSLGPVVAAGAVV